MFLFSNITRWHLLKNDWQTVTTTLITRSNHMVHIWPFHTKISGLPETTFFGIQSSFFHTFDQTHTYTYTNYTFAYTYTNVHTHIHKHTHTRFYLQTNTQIHKYAHTCKHTNMYTHTHAHETQVIKQLAFHNYSVFTITTKFYLLSVSRF